MRSKAVVGTGWSSFLSYCLQVSLLIMLALVSVFHIKVLLTCLGLDTVVAPIWKLLLSETNLWIELVTCRLRGRWSLGNSGVSILRLFLVGLSGYLEKISPCLSPGTLGDGGREGDWWGRVHIEYVHWSLPWCCDQMTSCCGLSGKCPSWAHVFEHLVSSWWCFGEGNGTFRR